MNVSGTSAGQLQVWDLDDRRIVASRQFKNDVSENKNGGMVSINAVNSGPNPLANFINCLQYSSDGSLLAVGFSNGVLKLLNANDEGNYEETESQEGDNSGPQALPDVVQFRHCQGAITHIDFNITGEWLAVAGTDRTVSIYRWYHRDEDVTKPVEWIFVGKHRSHYKPITSLYFEKREATADKADLDSDEPVVAFPRLFSLGDDRVLQEYDLKHSSIRQGIRLKSSCSVEQTATPTAMCCLPRFLPPKDQQNPNNPSGNNTESGSDSNLADVAREYGENVILTTSDEYKLRVWDLNSTERSVYALTGEDIKEKPTAQIKLCRQTALAPTYGAPINKLFVLPARAGKTGAQRVPSEILVYGTCHRNIGLILMPLDGNPNKSMATIAHPGEISSITCSFDGQYLITAGGPDRSVKLWSINSDAFRASAAISGQGMEPFLSLVQGGKNGQFFQELLDYFYYAQLRSQGVSTTSKRVISGYIPIDEAINLMRALGYYPTEQDIANIKAEVRYEHFDRVGPLRLQVDLETVIRLYVNHRPVTGVSKNQIELAFEALGLQPGEPIDRDFLIHSLTNLGETMSLAEVAQTVDILIGAASNSDPLSFLNKGQDEEEDVHVDPRYGGEGKVLLKLPESLSSSTFAEDILGFNSYDDEKTAE